MQEKFLSLFGAETFEKEWESLESIQFEDIIALENQQLLYQFILYFADRQFGSEKMPMTSSPKHKVLRDQVDEADIRPQVLSTERTSCSSVKIKAILNKYAKYIIITLTSQRHTVSHCSSRYLVTQPVPLAFLKAFYFDLRIMKHAISRQKTFAFVLLWIEASFKTQSTSRLLHRASSDEFTTVSGSIFPPSRCRQWHFRQKLCSCWVSGTFGLPFENPCQNSSHLLSSRCRWTAGKLCSKSLWCFARPRMQR